MTTSKIILNPARYSSNSIILCRGLPYEFGSETGRVIGRFDRDEFLRMEEEFSSEDMNRIIHDIEWHDLTEAQRHELESDSYDRMMEEVSEMMTTIETKLHYERVLRELGFNNKMCLFGTDYLLDAEIDTDYFGCLVLSATYLDEVKIKEIHLNIFAKTYTKQQILWAMIKLLGYRLCRPGITDDDYFISHAAIYALLTLRKEIKRGTKDEPELELTEPIAYNVYNIK